MELRPFTKQDWYAWAGAEKPSETQEPLISPIKIMGNDSLEAIVIVDNVSICLYAWDNDGNDVLACVLETPFITGKAFVEHVLTDEVNIKQLFNEYGFEDTNSQPEWLAKELA